MARISEIGIFDVIGPNMIGPSSSHTAGALRIARLAAQMLPEIPVKVRFTLYGSFARTYKGHGTDRALLAGILGLHSDDRRLPDSFQLARQKGLDYAFIPDARTTVEHPNTVDIELTGAGGRTLTVRGQSLGGGRAVITSVNGVAVEFSGNYNTLIINNIDQPGVVADITTALSKARVNIAFMKLYRERRGSLAYTFIETDELIPETVASYLKELTAVRSAVIVPALDQPQDVIPGQEPLKAEREDQPSFETLDFNSAAELQQLCQQRQLSLAEVMLQREMALTGLTAQQIRHKMQTAWHIMVQSAQMAISQPRRSMGGLIGGEASALMQHLRQTASQGSPAFLGQTSGRAAAYAMGVLEINASMGLIVAAPTAGASGIVPGVLLAVAEQAHYSEAQMIEALLAAAAVGLLCTANGSVAGAEGGCQAETGTAAAMAASAVVYLAGGQAEQSLNAAATALQNVLGLVCDPIGGLVELPCQKRNAIGAVNALLCAELALAGIAEVIPLDDMILTARQVGASLPASLRETALGGTAQTAAARSLLQQHE